MYVNSILKCCLRNQIFNELNSRKCNGEQNVFEGFFDNWIFSAVMFFTVVLQIMMIELFGSFAQTTGLTWAQWGASIGLGALALPWGIFVRLVHVDNSDGQIQIDPKEFEVAPFPGDQEDSAGMIQQTNA